MRTLPYQFGGKLEEKVSSLSGLLCKFSPLFCGKASKALPNWTCSACLSISNSRCSTMRNPFAPCFRNCASHREARVLQPSHATFALSRDKHLREKFSPAGPNGLSPEQLKNSHSLRRLPSTVLHQNHGRLAVLKIDLKNAFNALSLQGLEIRHYSRVRSRPFLKSPISLLRPTVLLLQSTSEASPCLRQGDPLGPVLFCLTINNVISKCSSPFST
ncbi:hypothetical protein Ciccas_003072 [Cichlidogyrus casuarinus]|uniref:Reverse transcriptase domain-containing protein n=1 Tax=Cichlidogyrus casuarinus TaxID=1844966 RepID=A0ABD2QFF2_9PLAT